MDEQLEAAKKAHIQANGTKETPITVLDIKYKCANCGGDHQGNDFKCPKREEYQNLQRSLSQRNRRPTVYKREQSERNTYNPAPVYSGTSYSEAVKFGKSPHTPKSQVPHGRYPSFPLHPFPPPDVSGIPNSPNDLFTFEEVDCLLNDMLASLSACRNKTEQFRVITQLSLKYIYGHK